jgi:hypothetical protein
MEITTQDGIKAEVYQNPLQKIKTLMSFPLKDQHLLYRLQSINPLQL